MPIVFVRKTTLPVVAHNRRPSWRFDDSSSLETLNGVTVSHGCGVTVAGRMAIRRCGANHRRGRYFVSGQIGVANRPLTDIISRLMKLSRMQGRLCLALAIVPVLCAGCGGITASRSVSPLDFLIPGGFLLKADPPATNEMVLPPQQPQRQLAYAR